MSEATANVLERQHLQIATEGGAERRTWGRWMPYAIAVGSVVLATLLSFPLRDLFLHSRGLLLFVAIMFSAWYGGVKPGILATVLAATSFTAFFNDQHGIHPNLDSGIRLLVYVTAVSVAIWLMAQRNQALAHALTANQALEKAMEEIRVLRGILPICMHCKQIRDKQGSWQEVESYIAAQTEARFSHGVCPGCMDKFYPDVVAEHTR